MRGSQRTNNKLCFNYGLGAQRPLACVRSCGERATGVVCVQTRSSSRRGDSSVRPRPAPGMMSFMTQQFGMSPSRRPAQFRRRGWSSAVVAGARLRVLDDGDSERAASDVASSCWRGGAPCWQQPAADACSSRHTDIPVTMPYSCIAIDK